MTDLKPFQALRYAASAGEAGTLLAPPYDVIDAAEAERLREASPYNAVRLVLPEGEPPVRYEIAARRLKLWQERGVLVEDPLASLYAYRQTFTRGNERLTRRATFGALPLTPFDDRRVLAHERTHSGPKRDRLALTLACRAQLSPVFLLARDEREQIGELLQQAESGAPIFEATTPDGTEHTAWRIPQSELSARLCAVLTGHPLLIADGHHRYETALAAAAALPDLPRARRVLACVVGDRDPGLILEPTHRSLSHPPAGGRWEKFLAAAAGLEACGYRTPEEAADVAHRAGGGSLCVRENASGYAWLVRPIPAAAESGERAGERALRKAEESCASLLFDRVILQSLFGLDADEATRCGLLEYHRDPAAAARVAGPSGAVFFVPPVPLKAVWELALAGRRLPPKTTYFAPKIPSGLLFRTL